MIFFLPVQDPKIAEESYQNIKKTIETQTGWPISDTRYYEIHYRDGGQDLCAQVGGPDPLNGEIVFAIFKPKRESISALTAAVLCKTHQFWPAMTRRPSSLTKKTAPCLATAQSYSA